jgi:hypothetical protein
MKDKKYLFKHRMTYGTFMYLVRKLEPFVKFKVIMFVRAPLKFIKAIGLVLYRFAHGVSANIITNRFNGCIHSKKELVGPMCRSFLRTKFETWPPCFDRAHYWMIMSISKV